MKKIIVFCGVTNSGKSRTLNVVYDKLKGCFPDVKSWPRKRPESQDKVAVFTVNSNGLSMKIGITTEGDKEVVIKEIFEFFEQENCDLAIFASKTYGKTRDFFNKKKNSGLDVDFIMNGKKYSINNKNKYSNIILLEIENFLHNSGMTDIKLK